MVLRSFNSITKEKIHEIQKTLGIEFPKDYKEFLLKYNGGVVEKNKENSFVLNSIQQEIVIDVLFGIVDKKASDILYWNQQMKEDMLGGTLIIGDDIIQGFIVMICYGENKGIYYWDDAYNFETSNDESNMYWIAEDFDAFLQLLQ